MPHRSISSTIEEWDLEGSGSKQIRSRLLTALLIFQRRTKFSHDPNNTAWTNSTDSYGQRMLQSHGWAPGASLGARNKSYTRSKGTSHIRVTLKDDTLGLGAKSGPNVPQPGLDAFQGLLGRLNGKDAVELAVEQRTRDDLRRANYAEKRWGGLRFVSGGLLVGDRIEETAETQKPFSVDAVGTSITSSDDTNIKSAGAGLHDTFFSTVDNSPAATETTIAKKSMKSKKHTRVDEEETIQATEECADDDSMPAPEPGHRTSAVGASESSLELEKAQKRAEKAQRKLDRRVRRVAKRAMRAKDETESEHVPTKVELQDKSGPTAIAQAVTRPTLLSARSEGNGRNAVRQRYILQKKMALADPRALNEVR